MGFDENFFLMDVSMLPRLSIVVVLEALDSSNLS
jgi:hypothetical protein